MICSIELAKDIQVIFLTCHQETIRRIGRACLKWSQHSLLDAEDSYGGIITEAHAGGPLDYETFQSYQGFDMAITNRERVGKALDLLNEGLLPFVERELKAVYADRWQELPGKGSRRNAARAGQGRDARTFHLDCHALLTVCGTSGTPCSPKRWGRPNEAW